jgi:hypothetical protein
LSEAVTPWKLLAAAALREVERLRSAVFRRSPCYPGMHEVSFAQFTAYYL